MHRSMGRITLLALVALLVALVDKASGITTTESLVEATHTTLPVMLDDRENDGDTVTRSGDLAEAESKDPQRLEIIKQIRKVNQDGSYTVGYEADDGTFKIESRDVLGNVKGTYGYIDANGDIKRVSYGGGGEGRTRQTTAPVPVTEEDIVHIPPRFNRSQHQLLLVPTTRRPPNYQPPAQHLHHNPHHASTLRPSVIQTIPRKRPGYATMTTSTMATTATMTTTSTTTTPATPPATSTSATTSAGSSATSAMMTSPEPTTEMPSRHAGPSTSYGEQSTASSHTAPLLHTKPAGLLIIRPTPLPYQTLKMAEQQLARPERLVDPGPKFVANAAPHQSAKKLAGVRGNFLRRQLAAPATESGEQFEQQQQQQIVYGQSVSSADGGELYGRPVYSAHPTPRIPAAVLAARQRAAHIQSVLAASGGGERTVTPTTERVYVKQPLRPAVAAPVRHHEPAPIVYEPSTEPSSENAYVTDSPGLSGAVVQIPAANTRGAIASETEPEPEERRPIFRPRPTLEYRPRETVGRYRTPYGLPPPPAAAAAAAFGRPFSSQEHGFGDEVDGGRGDHSEDGAGQYQGLAPYRQQRRLPLPAAADTVYNQQQQQQQQPQNAYPVPVPYPGGRLPPSPYYYDIPAERPLTARDFERILQVLIYRHQQLQVAQQAQALRYPGGLGGYGGVPGYHGGGHGYPYNPYFPGPSAAPFGLGAGSYAGYPQQQIPRPPLPFPYGPSPYDGGYFQNPLYSPSAPSPSAAAAAASSGRGGGADPEHPIGGTGYGLMASRRQGQYYAPPQLDIGGGASSTASTRTSSNGDFLPPEVRESLLYRMLMLAIQAPGSGEVLPLAATSGLALQGASSMPQPNSVQRTPTLKPDAGASTVAAAATMAPMYSKKPVRSVQILGEE